MKADCAAVVRAPAKTVREAIWIKGSMSGLWKMFVARNPEDRKDRRVRERPRTTSKMMPAARMFFTWVVLSSARYWAVYFIIAEFTPQSLNMVMRLGAIMATATMPYSGGERSLARSMTPMAEMTVEAAFTAKTLSSQCLA